MRVIDAYPNNLIFDKKWWAKQTARWHPGEVDF
ncbi:hypothetical protein SAMN06265379_106158 [Saccharicrinis carchari]|uniref:Uncharacterized protein n=1 Tax=Saccharicrinis carchari TaxID=1168039 RepID=A0A521DTX2_SACCC|nr:hypothetical protein SAMN06265379_106158 [Saccharicrinis carchari]